MTAVKILAVSAMVALTAWGCAQSEPAPPEGLQYAYVTHGKVVTRELISRGNLNPVPMAEAKAETSLKPSTIGDTYTYVPEGKASRRVVRHDVVLAPEEPGTMVVRSNPEHPEPGSYYAIQGKQPARVLVHEVKISQERGVR